MSSHKRKLGSASKSSAVSTAASGSTPTGTAPSRPAAAAGAGAGAGAGSKASASTETVASSKASGASAAAPKPVKGPYFTVSGPIEGPTIWPKAVKNKVESTSACGSTCGGCTVSVEKAYALAAQAALNRKAAMNEKAFQEMKAVGTKNGMSWTHPGSWYNKNEKQFTSMCEFVPDDALVALLAPVRSDCACTYVMDFGQSNTGKPIVLPYPMRSASAAHVEQAFHCHFRTTWNREGKEYFDASLTAPTAQTFVFGELLPGGVRRALEADFMKLKTAKDFVDLGCGNGRMVLQAFLEHTHLNVLGVELHSGRFWKAYHGVLRLCDQNPDLFKVVSFDRRTVGARSITIQSRIFGNILSLREGNMFDPKFVPHIRQADILFVEVMFSSQNNDARQHVLHHLLELKRGASFLLYEPLSDIIRSVSNFETTTIEHKEKEKFVWWNVINNRIPGVSCECQPFEGPLTVPSIATTWDDSYIFSMWSRSKNPCKALRETVKGRLVPVKQLLTPVSADEEPKS